MKEDDKTELLNASVSKNNKRLVKNLPKIK